MDQFHSVNIIMPVFNISRPEEKLLLYCARTTLTLGDKERAWGLLKADLNWPYFVKIAKVHGVIPLQV